MTIVSNTSPINYLVLIDEIAVVPAIFDRVLVPPAVHAELRAAATPHIVQDWISNPPLWLSLHALSQPPPNPSGANRLDPGEDEAIALAVQTASPLILIDDRAGRAAARAAGLRTVGTLGVLDRADSMGIVSDLPGAVERLRSAGFRIAPDLVQTVLDRHERRRPR